MMSQPEPLWKRSIDKFPKTGRSKDRMCFLLGYAVLAPSGHNTQPWLFKVGEETVDVFADRTRSLSVIDPDDRELTISCGAAVGTLEVAARRFGLAAIVSTSPDVSDPDLLARISFAPVDDPQDSDIALFNAIQKRRTNRTTIEMTPLPNELLSHCKSMTTDLGLALSVLETASDRQAVAALVAEGDRLQFDDPAFREELAQWVRSSGRGAKDGMSGASFGMPDILSAVGSLVIRTFDLGNGIAASDEKKIVSGSPALMVLGSPTDDVANWLLTGRALSRVLLALTSQGVAASYLNQPIETTTLRPKLKAVVDMEVYPQILLRIGRAKTQPGLTVRRDLDSVILD